VIERRRLSAPTIVGLDEFPAGPFRKFEEMDKSFWPFCKKNQCRIDKMTNENMVVVPQDSTPIAPVSKPVFGI
jgi:hypothetical protein